MTERGTSKNLPGVTHIKTLLWVIKQQFLFIECHVLCARYLTAVLWDEALRLGDANNCSTQGVSSPQWWSPAKSLGQTGCSVLALNCWVTLANMVLQSPFCSLSSITDCELLEGRNSVLLSLYSRTNHGAWLKNICWMNEWVNGLDEIVSRINVVLRLAYKQCDHEWNMKKNPHILILCVPFPIVSLTICKISCVSVKLSLTFIPRDCPFYWTLLTHLLQQKEDKENKRPAFLLDKYQFLPLWNGDISSHWHLFI